LNGKLLVAPAVPPRKEPPFAWNGMLGRPSNELGFFSVEKNLLTLLRIGA